MSFNLRNTRDTCAALARPWEMGTPEGQPCLHPRLKKLTPPNALLHTCTMCECTFRPSPLGFPARSKILTLFAFPADNK